MNRNGGVHTLLPITGEAYLALLNEVQDLGGAVDDAWAEPIPEGMTNEDREHWAGATRDRRRAAAELHKTLRRVVMGAEVVEPDGRAVVGSLVTWKEPDGSIETGLLVVPGKADPLLGHLSPESPLGSALIGAKTGDVVQFNAPAGMRELVVLAVTQARHSEART
jgi:transcription elongation GreA/GreB family factor